MKYITSILAIALTMTSGRVMAQDSIKTINNAEAELVQKIKIGGLYEHYSGKRYKVLMIARSSEDTSLQVVYQGLYTDKQFGENPSWVRPLGMFVETVTIEGKQVPRFKEITDSAQK